jgi:futalosine hydrolase
MNYPISTLSNSHIVVVAATKMEMLPLLRQWEPYEVPDAPGLYNVEMRSVRLLITGVGMTATAFALGQYLERYPATRLVINAGIAGALDTRLELGSVVHVVTERFGDLGADDATGQFIDFTQNGLIPSDEPPFSGGRLINSMASDAAFLPNVHGITVQRVHGEASGIEAFQRQYPDVQVESMEGAAVFYACLQAGVPFLQIRAISNYVEARNVARWVIGPAVTNLCKTLTELVPLLPV